MSYDFQAAIDAAKAVVDRQSNGGNSNDHKYPLLYPPQGNSITLRILFNPASGQIVRLINRHEKTACYRTYGQECPICSLMQQVKDVTGQDPFGRTKSSRSRGLAFAQYIASTLPIEKAGNQGHLQPGETVLFMFPWSVYSQLNSIIQAIGQAGASGMDQAFCHANTGLFVNVSVTQDYKYTTVNNPYMTFQSAPSDEEFMKMLDGLESLNEQVLPSTITDEVSKQVNEYADAIYRQYLVPRVPQAPNTPAAQAPMNFNQAIPQAGPTSTVPPVPQAVAPTYAPAPPTTAGAPAVPQAAMTSSIPVAAAPPAPAPVSETPGEPACMGHHQPNSPQCICCPSEIICMQKGQS